LAVLGWLFNKALFVIGVHLSDSKTEARMPSSNSAIAVYKKTFAKDLRRTAKSKMAIIKLTPPVTSASKLAQTKKSCHEGLCDCKAKANATVIKKLRKGMRYFKAMAFEILLQDNYLYLKIQLPF
jgi:hypothetical protein